MTARFVCLILMGCLASTSWAQPKPRLRALLIGISDYRNPVWAKLPGCRMDVQTVSDFLTDPQGQVKADKACVTVLPEVQATKAGIEAALDRLLSEAQPGEVVYVHYSGHGAVVPSQAGGESDGMDECLVPIDAPDFHTAAYPLGVVRDKQVAAVLGALTDKVRKGGARGSVLFVFDSCHSGGISRAAGQVRVRQARGLREYFGKQAGSAPATATLRAAHPSASQGWVVLSACQYNQLAVDTNGGGAFTLALVAALQDPLLKPTSNYYDLMQLVGSNEVLNLQQTPQSAGDREQVLFSGALKPHQPWISVTKVAGDVLTLDKGSLLGLTSGTEISLYPIGTAAPEGKPLAVATVSGQHPLHAKATLKAGASSPDLQGAIGWVSAVSPDFERVSLRFDPKFPGPRAVEIRRALESSFPGQLNFVEQDGDLVFFGTDASGKPALSLDRREGGTAFQQSFSHPTWLPDLKDALTRELRVRYLLKIPDSDGARLKVSLVPGRLEGSRFQPGPPRLVDGSLLTYRYGEVAQLEVENTGRTPLYLSVFYLDSQGAMQALYPQPGDAANWKALQRGDTPLQIPISFSAPAGVDRIRVLGTREPIDLPYLLGGGKRSVQSATAMEQLLQNLLAGKRGGNTAASTGFEMSKPVPIRIVP